MSNENIPVIARQLFGDAKTPTGVNTPFVYSQKPNKGDSLALGNTPPGSKAEGLPIDCSSLLQQSLLASGYNVKYFTAQSGFRASDGSLSQAASKYYSQVSLDQAQVGDIVLTSGHVG